MSDLKHTHDNYPLHTRTIKNHQKKFENEQNKKNGEKKLENKVFPLFQDTKTILPSEIDSMGRLKIIKLGSSVRITKTLKNVKIQETTYGLDLFLINDVELTDGLTSEIKIGIVLEIPSEFFGFLSLDEEAAKEGVVMLNSQLIFGKKELVLYLRPISSWFIFKKGKKIGNIVFQKLETLNYEYNNI